MGYEYMIERLTFQYNKPQMNFYKGIIMIEPNMTLYPCGSKDWRINDGNQLHREDGPAREMINGDKHWYINGKRHRLDGPAIEWNDDHKQWWVNGKRHRLDGPAIVYKSKGIEWYINGRHVTTSINKWAKERDIDLSNLSDMDKAVIALEWSNYSG
jgi:hypothetical protein